MFVAVVCQDGMTYLSCRSLSRLNPGYGSVFRNQWPYHTFLDVSCVIGIKDENVANVWKELHGHQSNALTLMLVIWNIIGRGKN